MTSLLEVFCDVDDFWQSFDPLWQSQQKNKAQVQKVWQRTSCEINAGETRLWLTLNS